MRSLRNSSGGLLCSVRATVEACSPRASRSANRRLRSGSPSSQSPKSTRMPATSSGGKARPSTSMSFQAVSSPGPAVLQTVHADLGRTRRRVELLAVEAAPDGAAVLDREDSVAGERAREPRQVLQGAGTSATHTQPAWRQALRDDAAAAGGSSTRRTPRSAAGRIGISPESHLRKRASRAEGPTQAWDDLLVMEPSLGGGDGRVPRHEPPPHSARARKRKKPRQAGGKPVCGASAGRSSAPESELVPYGIGLNRSAVG